MNKLKNKDLNPNVGILVIGIILLAASLRAPITSVGPLISSIRESFDMSNTVAGTLTTLPLIAFAIFAPFVPKLARRFGIELTVLMSLIILTIGIFIRSSGQVELLFIGTFLIGIGIIIGNVLLPALVKQNFAHRVGLLTGVYAISMNVSAAVASGISVPIASIQGSDWKLSLGIWGLFTVLAVFFWLPQMRHKHKSVKAMGNTPANLSSNLFRSTLAWKITIFMGLQSLIYYSMVAWIPQILEEQGLTIFAAGWMTSIMQIAIFPVTFVVPILAGRLDNQRSLVAITSLSFCGGIGGLLVGSTSFTALWMILIGVGCGFAFSLSMMFFTLRTESVQQSSELSGMAQSIGYLLAASGPLLFGFVRDLTNSWTMPLILLIIATVIIFIVGMDAGKKGTITQPN